MRRRLQGAASAALLPTLALAVAAVLLPGRASLIVHLWLLVALALCLGALVLGIRADLPEGGALFASALTRPSRQPATPPLLVKIERELSMGTETAFDTHARLRPLVTTLASGILLDRHGVDLEKTPERARELVGENVWALVRPDATLPDDRSLPGMPLAAVEQAVDDLERLAWS
jgi:hypothetical protein